MPPTIWSAAMLVYLTEGWGSILLAVLVQLAGTVTIQGYATYEIALIMSERDREHDLRCTVRDFWLTRVCSIVFIMLVLQDLKETYDMGRWLSRFPRAKQWTPLRLREYVSHSPGNATELRRHTAMKPVSGVTTFGRCCTAAAVLVPKMSIGLTILYYGSAYVMSAHDRDSLLQNSVALVFVLEIDNAVYELFIPNHLKQLVLKIQEYPIGLSSAEFDDAYAAKYRCFGLVGLPLILIGLLCFLDWKWCVDTSDTVVDTIRMLIAMIVLASAGLTTLSLRGCG
uniref:Uncharacterized protein n=1 Tax=Zooxanthella nutricula TaxID=1333877 RepID=A0A7S2H708_9DINO